MGLGVQDVTIFQDRKAISNSILSYIVKLYSLCIINTELSSLITGFADNSVVSPCKLNLVINYYISKPPRIIMLRYVLDL